MKCPLMIAHVPLAMSEDNPAVGDCLKEECAWWDEILDRCAVKTLGTCLDGILAQGKGLLDKIPHEE